MNARLWTIPALLLTTACVTINVYFPEAAIKDLSKQIESEIAKQAAAAAAKEAGTTTTPTPPATPAPRTPGPSASLIDELLGATPAYAADAVPSPEVSSPAIRRIIEARAQRAAAIAKLKAAGVVGEGNKGALEVRALDAAGDLRARAEAQRLLREENADRDELYKEIAAAKGVDAAQLAKVRETYAATLRENAKPGELIQLPDGTWKQK